MGNKWVIEPHGTAGKTRLVCNGRPYAESIKGCDLEMIRHRISCHPDLLEALETLLPLAIHTSPQDVAIQQARAAIHKAKGE